MDYCSGGDLSKYINKNKRLTEEISKIYLSEVVLALEHIHNNNVIYRDLKPENIVIDEKGHANLTDFGLSKVGVVDQLGARTFCGSFAYMAPEMINGAGHGKTIDWYHLGVLLYEMLTGEPPHFDMN